MADRMTERRTSMLGALLATLGPISMSLYTPAMPQLVEAFGTTESAIKLTLSFYFAGFAFAQLLAGPLSDAFGRRVATLSFLAVYLAGSLLAAYAPSVDWLLAGRLIQGIGASVGITVARAIVRDQFVGEEASRIMNLIGIMLAIGPAIAPTLGGLTLAAFGWQSVFFLMVGFGLLSCLTMIVFLKETTVPEPHRARPGPVMVAYRALASDSRFLASAMVIGGSRRRALCAIDNAALHPDPESRPDADPVRHGHADAVGSLFLGLHRASFLHAALHRRAGGSSRPGCSSASAA